MKNFLFPIFMLLLCCFTQLNAQTTITTKDGKAKITVESLSLSTDESDIEGLKSIAKGIDRMTPNLECQVELSGLVKPGDPSSEIRVKEIGSSCSMAVAKAQKALKKAKAEATKK
jgi:hypothetical protein